MPLFLTSLAEPSQDHAVEPLSEGFLILPVAGREEHFQALADCVVQYVGPFAAYARRAPDGTYEAVHILPEDMGTQS